MWVCACFLKDAHRICKEKKKNSPEDEMIKYKQPQLEKWERENDLSIMRHIMGTMSLVQGNLVSAWTWGLHFRRRSLWVRVGDLLNSKFTVIKILNNKIFI